MHNFFETYFGFQPTLAEIIWTILLAVIPRALMWAWKKRPPRGEGLYYLIALPSALILLSALRFATRGTGFAPDVRATIKSIAVLPEGEPSSDPSLANKGALALMIVHVNNLGTPTIVSSYHATATYEGEKFEGHPITWGHSMSGTQGDYRLTFDESSSLFSKTRRPIATGDSVAGVLLIEFPNVAPSSINRPNTSYCLHFEDAAAHWYEQCTNLPNEYTNEPKQDPDLDMKVEKIAP